MRGGDVRGGDVSEEIARLNKRDVFSSFSRLLMFCTPYMYMTLLMIRVHSRWEDRALCSYLGRANRSGLFLGWVTSSYAKTT